MGLSQWLAGQYITVIETASAVGGLLLTAYTIRKDTKERRLSNRISLSQRHGDIWKEFYERPGLSRVLKPGVDLKSGPVSEEERLFVKLLILHLDTVHQATRGGMLTKVEGLTKDVREFFSLPIPAAVWQKMKPYQNQDFVSFIESSSS
jgi:hypothetical protein